MNAYTIFKIAISIVGMFVGLGLLFWVSWHKAPNQRETNLFRAAGLLGGCLLVSLPLILGAWLTWNIENWYCTVFVLSSVAFALFCLAWVWIIIKWIRGEVKKLFLAGLVVSLMIFTGFVAFCIYLTFVQGTTPGPDFIRAIQSGSLATDAISSIEVVKLVGGYTPFTAGELDSLPRRAKIDSPTTVSRLVTLLRSAQPGWESREMNHPSTKYSTYLKVNTRDGFFWLYCNVEQDGEGATFTFHANTLNSTNPNEGGEFHIDNFSEILAILTNGTNPEPDKVVLTPHEQLLRTLSFTWEFCKLITVAIVVIFFVRRSRRAA